MEKLHIELGEKSYFINIGKGLLKRLPDYIKNGDKYLLITDENVNLLYGDFLEKKLECEEIFKFVIKAGEESKTIATVEDIIIEMAHLGLTRKSKIIALGGGVVGDIAGFCASIYMRGISFIQIPTTFLSQVDSSVGGKTGVNMKNAKNMVGTFYQPESVIIDIDTLRTLPKRELISAMGEIIKYGIIWDYKFLQYIEKNMEDILDLKDETIKIIIKRSCEIKSQIVSMDEKELGIRKILNCGHTLAHSLETISEYKIYNHGEAVLIGIYYEALMAKRLGYIEDNYFQEIEKVINKLNINLDISDYLMEDLIQIMKRDKKNKEGKISFILPKGKGKVEEIMLKSDEISW